MKSIYELFVLLAVAVTWLLIYQNFSDDIKNFFFAGEPTYVVYLGDVAIEVTVADEQEERIKGLSGVESLGDFEGKLFIFDTEDHYGIWMRDMLIPIDVMWFNNDLELIHVERNLTPESFPDSFTSDEPARFVLEVNAYFIDSLKIQEGSRLIVPPELLPRDIRERLQQ